MLDSYTNKHTSSSLSEKPVIAVVGPTASGKSEFAEQIAMRLNGEILSADSMQVYRGMDIGTAKVSITKRHVPYHGIDLVDPGDQFSAALYQTYARNTIAEIRSRGARPILCGGTGLYVKAALDDLRFPAGEQVVNPTREKYLKLAQEHGALWLHKELSRIDPKSAELIEANNVRRTIRAFEMLNEGTSYASQHAHAKDVKPFLDAVYLGLKVSPEILTARIAQRVDAMVEAGLYEEVKSLIEKGMASGVTSTQAIGYKELMPLAKEGKTKNSPEFADAISSIKTATRHYAKRQRTWFKRETRIIWVDADKPFTDHDYENIINNKLC